MTTPDSTPIADRVRFWEEQDKINKELIPRVIRQHELLTAHVTDHENLVETVSNAMQQALDDARREQHQNYEAALATAKTDINNEAQANLDQAMVTLNLEWRKTRNLVTAITTGAIAIGLAALIIGILI